MHQQNPPKRHHYIPCFYLERWTGADGCLEQFSRPYGLVVKDKRVPPSATGYRDYLYTMHGLPPDRLQQVEQRFMKQVDDWGALGLSVLERGPPFEWSSKTRSGWTRFIQSLQLRTPSDIEAIKRRTTLDWRKSAPAVQAAYELIKRDDDPPTFEEYAEIGDPHLVDRIGVYLTTTMIDSPKIGEHINGMHWDVLDLTKSRLELLTCDRPVERTHGLGKPECLITIPIGRKKLFIAANQQRIIDRLRRANATEVVRLRNGTTVRFAKDFVWASSRSQGDFIRNHFGTSAVLSTGERLEQQSRSFFRDTPRSMEHSDGE